MLDEAACERRVYRLAVLLTGRPEAAVEVIVAVVASPRSLRALDGAHLDRLTILRSREMAAGTLVSDLVPSELASALGSLPAQPRESWVLARVFATPLRETARAMDCSVTATKLHLAQADSVMDAAATDRQAAIEPWRRYAASLEVPEFFRESRQRMARRRRVVVAAAFVVVAAGMLVVMLLV
jgi:DNA-directed RNA polymerase specialized sigma24 family protein